MKQREKMASIRKRLACGCINISYQVQIRRKGIKSLTISFCTYEEAVSWVHENEESFLENPESFDYLRKEYRTLRRDREFKRKKLPNYIPRKRPKNLQHE